MKLVKEDWVPSKPTFLDLSTTDTLEGYSLWGLFVHRGMLHSFMASPLPTCQQQLL